MDTHTRNLLFAIGLFAAIGAGLFGYRAAIRKASAEKYRPLATTVSDLAPGKYRFRLDLYKPKNVPSSREILFLRKPDGTLRTWYFHVVDRQPAAPDEDWEKPGTPCDSFAIDAETETIECIVTDRENNQKIVLHWSWDGKSSSPFAPDLLAVPGEEKNGVFKFGAEALDPAFRPIQAGAS
jgi:hypothetical protein